MKDLINGIPYRVARFDKRGERIDCGAIPAGTTDLFVFAHGWRNDEADAEKLYTEFFTNFAAVGPAWPAERPGAILGVMWPSRNFDAFIAAQAAVRTGGAAAVGGAVSDAESRQKLVDALDNLAEEFAGDSPQAAALLEAREKVADLDDSRTARTAFVEKLRGLADEGAKSEDDGSEYFFALSADDLFKRLTIPLAMVDAAVPRTGRALALSPGRAAPADGRAAGVLDVFKGAAGAGLNVVSYLSYFLMKERAGLVGEKGLAKLLDDLDTLAPTVERVHLIGHSFGGRVMAATATASQTSKIHSMAFLQAAFSHNGFSPQALMNGVFRPVVERNRVRGPLLVTHTKNDTAVGIHYPLASRISGSMTSALGDKNDKYGALGSNGAQQMNPGEVIEGVLGDVGEAYAFQAGKFHNLLGDQFIKDHGGVTGPQVAAAVKAAALHAGS